MSAQRVGLLADRYIPYRKCLSTDHFTSSTQKAQAQETSTNCSSYAKLIASCEKRCLTFSKKIESDENCIATFSNKCLPLFGIKSSKEDKNAIESITAEQIILIPGIKNNYYYNVLDYSSKGMISVALGDECFLSYEQKITEVRYNRNFFESSISCVKFNRAGTLLYLGDTCGAVNVIDVQMCQPVRYFKSHAKRIGCMQNTEQWGFLSGSRDKSVIHNDLRLKNPDVQQFLIHQEEVCGLTFKNFTVASGSNDGKVIVWDLQNKRKSRVHNMHQRGAVKALQWCPWKSNLLVSGGGSKDHQIIFWNSQNDSIQKKIDGKSQITNLIWRQSTKDIVSSHGGSSQSGGQCYIWDAYTYKPTHKLVGHKQRVIGMAINPNDLNQICTVSGDQTMRFWTTTRGQEAGAKKSKQGDHLSKQQSMIR